MTELLAVPLKRASDIDVTRALKNWISATFSSSERPINVSNALEELQKLRQKAVRLNELGEIGLNAVSNYYDQIASLERKIPANEVNIPFKWKDAFDRGSLFGGRISLSIPTLAYERVCILFNVGALNSGVAADQNLESDEGLQKALKKLQLAAGIFLHLKDSVIGTLQQDTTPDLDPDTLGVLADLMLAQAQEMVVLKAIRDKMKDQIVAKLCVSCEELFAIAMKNMQRDTVRGNWDSDWLPNVSGKQAIYNGLAQYHQSRICNAQKAVGEEIARLQYAQRLLQAGIDRGHNPDLASAKEWLRRTEKALTEAKKDNDFIYHERIPEEKALAPIVKVAVAKPTPRPEYFGTEKTDLFEELVPVAIHQALSGYSVRKTEIVNRECGKLKEATNVLNATLSSMNLPAALEDTSGSEMPQSLKDKSTAVVEAGGVTELAKMIEELPDLLQRNKEILDEADRMLREERESDDQLRHQFGAKWNRIASEKLTTTFTSNTEKYRTILNNATDADKIVRDKFDKHRASIEMLGKGPSEMQKNLPSSGGVKGSPTITKLKALMEDVETLKVERQVIESEIKAVNPDMKPVFFDALNKEGSISEQTSAESLARAFGPLQKQVTDSLARQEQLLEEIRTHHQKFVGETGVDGKSAREEIMKQWAAAHDAFFEVKGNLLEGTKFYNDLTQLLVTFQNKVSDFCFARRTEKEELLKDLTSGLSRMNLESSAPAAPAHHTTAPTTVLSPTPTVAQPTSPSRPPRKNDAPPRPPPPTAGSPSPNPYAGAPVASSAPYSGAPPSSTAPYPGATTTSSPPYSGAPTATDSATNPYMGAPQQQAANPYGGAPYPVQPGMQVPYHPYPYPVPGYAPYPQGYPPQQPGYPGYPPQYPPQQPGYPGYPPQPGQQPPGYYPPQSGPQWR